VPEGIRIQIAAFEPLTIVSPQGRLFGRVMIELPSLHLPLCDLNAELVAAGADAHSVIAGMSFDTGKGGLTAEQIADFIRAESAMLRQYWRAYQDKLDQQGREFLNIGSAGGGG